MNPVRSSAEFVVQHSRHVRFDPQAAEAFVQERSRQSFDLPAWQADYHFIDGTPRTVAYVLVLDSLNFCFWGQPRWTIEYNGERLDGYFALSASLKRAFEQGQPLDDAAYLANITKPQLAQILAGSGEIPLLQERAQILREVGTILLRHFRGQATRLVESAGGSALRLLDLLAEHFPNFRDEARFQGQKVFLYKRAQILCADLYWTFAGKRWGAFSDMDQLTAFADYKLPQLLRAHGVLHYEPALAEKVDQTVELPAGSPEEVEIRAHTVHAVEQLKALFAKQGKNLPSYQIDWLLWNWSLDIKAKPYHRTRTTFY